MGSAYTSVKIKDSYKDVFHIDNSNAGVDGTVRTLVDGNGTDSGVAISTGGIFGANANGGGVLDEAATATNPTLVPDRADLDTGWGAIPGTADVLSGIAGGVELFRIVEGATSYVQVQQDVASGGPVLRIYNGDDPASGETTQSGRISFYIDATTDDGGSYAPVEAASIRLVKSGDFYNTGAAVTDQDAEVHIYSMNNGVAVQAVQILSGGAMVLSNRIQATQLMGPTDSNTYIDVDTGGDIIEFVAGGVTGLKLIESTGVLQQHQISTGLTADSGSAQGGTPLTSSYNVIATCATAGDSVTLPSAAAGYKVTIINNGAESADVFPATDDDCGAGANTAVALASGADVTYLAIDNTTWEDIT